MKIPIKTMKEEENTTESQPNEEVQETQETDSLHEEESAQSISEEDAGAETQTDEFEPAEADEQETEDVLNEAEEEEEEEEDEVARLKKQLAAAKLEAKEHYDARLRIQAEFDNFKKRKEKEVMDFRKYANESLIQELLLVVDDFDRAIAAAEQSHKLEDFLKGVELIFDKFLGMLKKKGVKEIEAEGQPFNPEIHEAVTQIPTNDVEEGTVVAVFQKGYYLHDRVVLAPKVGVAKNDE